MSCAGAVSRDQLALALRSRRAVETESACTWQQFRSLRTGGDSKACGCNLLIDSQSRPRCPARADAAKVSWLKSVLPYGNQCLRLSSFLLARPYSMTSTFNMLLPDLWRRSLRPTDFTSLHAPILRRMCQVLLWRCQKLTSQR